MRPNGSPAELERRRLRAIELLDKGDPPVRVAEIVGVDRRSVRRWKAAYRKNGKKGITARPAAGRPPKLNVREKQKLVRLLGRGAQKQGYPTDIWTCPRVADVISDQFDVDYDPSQVWRILRCLGWTPQKPVRIAVERNETEIARWKKEEWPRIKKK